MLYTSRATGPAAELPPPPCSSMTTTTPSFPSLRPYEAIHAECMGGEIDKLSNKRVVIGCFPWKFQDGESCISRIVAFDGFEDV